MVAADSPYHPQLSGKVTKKLLATSAAAIGLTFIKPNYPRHSRSRVRGACDPACLMRTRLNCVPTSSF